MSRLLVWLAALWLCGASAADLVALFSAECHATHDWQSAVLGSEVSAAKALLAEHEGRGRALYE